MSDITFNVKTLRDDTRLIETGTVLDNSNADRFAMLITDLYAADMKYLIIDMSSLEFLSSAGVGSILGTVELFRERGGEIVLAHVGENIMHVLKVLDLTEYLTICPSTEEAAARCGV